MIERTTSPKSADAYRTISEVAEDLKLPQHVLRFWETRFPQVKPLKRAGGRRFYRPGDVELLRAVKALLYGDGYTIRGVQRILREQGVRAVAALASAPAPDADRGPETPDPGPAELRGIDAAIPVDSDNSADTRPEAGPASPHTGRGEAGLLGAIATLRDVLTDLADCERILDAARTWGR